MNRRDARKIAEDVTSEQLSDMFKRAKLGVRDWSAVSSVNPYFTKGKSWNILYPVFMSGRRLVKPAVINMVHEFGDFLEESLKPVKPARRIFSVTPVHEEPNFEVR